MRGAVRDAVDWGYVVAIHAISVGRVRSAAAGQGCDNRNYEFVKKSEFANYPRAVSIGDLRGRYPSVGLSQWSMARTAGLNRWWHCS